MDRPFTYSQGKFQARRNAEGAVVVTRDGVNPMPGATQFASIQQARRGMAALTVAEAIAGGDSAKVGEVFWALLTL